MIAPKAVTLDDLKVSENSQIRALVGCPAMQQRLGEMGLTPGATVQVIRVAPLGDPVQILVRNYQLSLRRSESRCVIVDPVSRSSATE